MKKEIILSFSVIALWGCSSTNTGEIDFRRVEPVSDIGAAEKRYRENCKGAYGEAVLPVSRAKCRPMFEVRMDRQNSGFGRPIISGDVYSLRLEHGLIADISELPFPLSRPGGGSNPFRPTGEIVILANVFEFGASNPKFLDPIDLTQAKVVYFSDDVRAHQDLNFKNIPLQAPVAYSGNPIGIQLMIVEMDRTSGPAESLISRLAELGKTSDYLPGSTVNTLLDLGAALLQQNHDDLIFEYRMVLDPSTTSAHPASSPFEEGRYILMRNEDRDTEIPWNDFRFDPETGKIYRTEPQRGAIGMADYTYFSVNVVKHPSGTKPSGYSFESFAAFSQRFEQEISDRDAPLSTIQARVEKDILDARAASWEGLLSKKWVEVAERANLYSSYLPQIAEVEARKCELLPESIEARDAAQRVAFNAALDFVALYQKAANEKVSDEAGADPILDESEKRGVLLPLASYFVPFEGSPISGGELSDPDGFLANYGAKPTAFADAVIAEAERDVERSNCDRLILDIKAKSGA